MITPKKIIFDMYVYTLDIDKYVISIDNTFVNYLSVMELEQNINKKIYSKEFRDAYNKASKEEEFNESLNCIINQ